MARVFKNYLFKLKDGGAEEIVERELADFFEKEFRAIIREFDEEFFGE